jgi:UDP-N-acetyl-D-glucosamine dehydrogenase
MKSIFHECMDKLNCPEVTIGIIGLGSTGLSIAHMFALRGIRVLGFDTSEKHDQLKESNVPDLASNLHQLHELDFKYCTSLDQLLETDVMIICLSQNIKGVDEPDFSKLVGTIHEIANLPLIGQLVIMVSPVVLGGTRTVILPEFQAMGLHLGTHFFLGCSPQPSSSQASATNLVSMPRLVSGIDDSSTKLISCLFDRLGATTIAVSTPEIAEASKMLESAYRCVNTAMVNELKTLFDRIEIDIRDVVRAAEATSTEFQAFQAGPGVGWDSNRMDTIFLSRMSKRYGMTTRLLDIAGQVNEAMPKYVVNRVADALNDCQLTLKGSRIAIIGIASVPDAIEYFSSPGIEIMDLLRRKGAFVTYNDPFLPQIDPSGRFPNAWGISVPLTLDWIQLQDVILILANHSDYDWNWIVHCARLVVDTRDATRNVQFNREKIVFA